MHLTLFARNEENTMPVDNSRLKGFYKLDVEERRQRIAELAGLTEEQVAALAANGELDDAAADRMIENVIGTMSLPVGVATVALYKNAMRSIEQPTKVHVSRA